MKKLHVCFWASLAALLLLAAVPADAADVKELFAIDLADSSGKEGRMIEVSYPPGAQDVVHRHDAQAFVYVLEGQIIMLSGCEFQTPQNARRLISVYPSSFIP